LRPVVLFDTLSIFFRAHHALPPMNTSAGEPTAALYGFCSLLLKIVREHHPAGIAFALDAPEKTFRHQLYEAYKATRAAPTDDLRRQLACLGRLWACLDVPVFRVPGFEADDILATLAKTLRNDDVPALILSGDRDLLQLAHGSVTVLFTGARGRDAVLYDAAKVVERFGVLPEQLPSYAAFVGDPSDNLPGVRGIGSRTAADLVRRFHDVRTVIERAHEIERGPVREAIALAKDQLLRNEDLSRLRDDVPLPAGPIAKPLDLDAIARLRELFAELEFKSLVSRLEPIEERIRGEAGG
jgi:DNA polymerase-1